MRLLNIGCGDNFHPSWTNLDVVSGSAEVIAHDIRKGLPFSDSYFDAVYHSHVIEHLSLREAIEFMKECVRVLRPGGWVRVATPDLEAMVRVYLDRLEAAGQGVAGAEADLRWITLELFDQMVRDRPGGEMGRYLRRPDIPNKSFIISRIGLEAKSLWETGTAPKRSMFRAGSFRSLRLVAGSFRNTIAGLLVRVLSGAAGHRTFREGVFRNSGEVHRWLYDRLSLSMLLQQAGLIEIRSCAAGESSIPDFAAYDLEVLHGSIRKPDSLFMEAVKPLVRVSGEDTP